jgi:hypothetical protein
VTRRITLFAYGSLLLPEVQRWLFGRDIPGAADALPGARTDWVDDIDPDLLRLTGQRGYPALHWTDAPDAVVHGQRLALTVTELRAADAYEGTGYVRRMACLQSGRRAWVYVGTTTDGL